MCRTHASALLEWLGGRLTPRPPPLLGVGPHGQPRPRWCAACRPPGWRGWPRGGRGGRGPPATPGARQGEETPGRQGWRIERFPTPPAQDAVQGGGGPNPKRRQQVWAGIAGISLPHHPGGWGVQPKRRPGTQYLVVNFEVKPTPSRGTHSTRPCPPPGGEGSGGRTTLPLPGPSNRLYWHIAAKMWHKPPNRSACRG